MPDPTQQRNVPIEMTLTELLSSALYGRDVLPASRRNEIMAMTRKSARIRGYSKQNIMVTLLRRPMVIDQHFLMYEHWELSVPHPLVFGRCSVCRKHTLVFAESSLLVSNLSMGWYAIFCSQHCQQKCRQLVPTWLQPQSIQSEIPIVYITHPSPIPKKGLTEVQVFPPELASARDPASVAKLLAESQLRLSPPRQELRLPAPEPKPPSDDDLSRYLTSEPRIHYNNRDQRWEPLRELNTPAPQQPRPWVVKYRAQTQLDRFLKATEPRLSALELRRSVAEELRRPVAEAAATKTSALDQLPAIDQRMTRSVDTTTTVRAETTRFSTNCKLTQSSDSIANRWKALCYGNITPAMVTSALVDPPELLIQRLRLPAPAQFTIPPQELKLSF